MHAKNFTDQLNYLLADLNDPICIVANGCFPEHVAIQNLIRTSSLVIACDGAVKQLAQQQFRVDYVIGDGDSITANLATYAQHPYILISEQSSNDLTKAINWVVSKYGTQRTLLIFASSGKREDHTLANFALLHEYLNLTQHVIMVSDYGILQPLTAGSHKLKSWPGQQISLFSLASGTTISCRQLKWPLVEAEFNSLYQGTLNQATAEQLIITATQPIMVYSAFETKAM